MLINKVKLEASNTNTTAYQAGVIQNKTLQSAIFNSANFSSIATDANGVIQIFNVGAERMLGYTAAEMINKLTPADISDPQEIITRAKALSKELDTQITPGFDALVFKASRGIEDIYELTYIRKDGSRFPAIVSVTALRDAQDAIIGFLLIGTDNSARQEADDQLWQASQYARSLLEASLDPLVTINADGKITDINEASIEATGVAREKLIGTDFSDYFTDPQEARKGYQEAFLKGSVTDYPLTIRHSNGRLTDVLYNASVYRDQKADVLGVFAAARDITARKKAEEALVKAGALQSAIFNSANFSSIATDAKGVIQIFNVGAERMLGYSADEVMDQNTPADISDPQELLARAQVLSDEFNTPIMPGFEALVFKASRGIEDIYELTYIRKDGTRFPAVVSVTALRDAKDCIIGYLLIGTDNSARRQVEEARTRMIQIEKLSSLGTMVGGVAHEINNPLMGVMNYVEYARDKAVDAKSVEVLDNALQEIERIRVIVKHMLVFVRADSTHQPSCSLDDAVKRTAALLNGEFRKNALRLHLDLPTSLPQIKCSASSLQQVLVNLLLNGRDALIALKEPIISISARQESGKIVLLVSDNGPGIDAQVSKKIFDPFFTTKPIGKGTGLGLSVSRQLLEEVGGSLDYTGNQGPGACFRLIFELA